MIKLITDKVVKQYEFTYLLPEFLTSAEITKAQGEVEELIKKFKGKIISSEDWGKKTLSYKIKKQGKRHAEALFIHMVLEFETANVPKFEKDVYLNDKIIRHLLVIAEKESPAIKVSEKAPERVSEKEKPVAKEKATA